MQVRAAGIPGAWAFQLRRIDMGKIIFLDVDGTLVDYENRLPDSAVTAVRRARENGHRVYILSLIHISEPTRL